MIIPFWTFSHLQSNNQLQGFPGGSEIKASAWNEGDPGSILGREDPLEKEMATHSSTLAWRIPWTEEPGRLQSMGSQRVGHDWATSPSVLTAVLDSEFYKQGSFLVELTYLMRGSGKEITEHQSIRAWWEAAVHFTWWEGIGSLKTRVWLSWWEERERQTEAEMNV